ncbi:N-acetylmuramoyl-L-alanine amidase [Pseudomonas phage LUZ100]|jgi:N-acetyl-anhydromuramyl-L-alanine amidase AmpD|uniref:N-acetylmuramoyl-L-alanine amidase n=1 Tax=Pseudomonas phage LUZ100 TaxID=2973522 RepID=A0A9Y1GKD6_9CAUD|nr:N-acetylmuramoyl-L-alanine amidase [Pseudomonas phage LUZ100]
MNREIDTLIIHTAATKATADIGAVDIDKWHRARGWLGCGYHFVIRRNGTIESDELGHRCRPLAQAGAHVGDCGPGWNKRSIGICLAGGIDANGKAENNYTPEQWKSLEEVVLSLLERFPSIKTIGGHRDLIRKTGAPPKDCPCFNVKDWFEKEVKPKYPEAAYIQAVKYI